MGKKVEIVADIGINHGGDINLALKLVEACVYAGVDTIKFQTVSAEVAYKKEDPLYKIFRDTELSINNWIDLRNTVTRYGKEFLSTPGDILSVDLLENLGVSRYKIASDSAENINFVNYVLSKDKPYILSTGMSDTDKIISIVRDIYNPRPEYLLHCVSEYPTPVDHAHLSRILRFKKEFPDIKIGYSDHVAGYDASLAAVVIGAELVEKHIKWDNNCIDSAVSLNPLEFKEMVDKIRNLEKMI